MACLNKLPMYICIFSFSLESVWKRKFVWTFKTNFTYVLAPTGMYEETTRILNWRKEVIFLHEWKFYGSFSATEYYNECSKNK